MRNYQTAFFESALADNDSFEQWRDAGERDVQQRANAAWKKSLSEYEAPPLDEGVDEALQDFMARRKDSMPDAWH